MVFHLCHARCFNRVLKNFVSHNFLNPMQIIKMSAVRRQMNQNCLRITCDRANSLQRHPNEASEHFTPGASGSPPPSAQKEGGSFCLRRICGMMMSKERRRERRISGRTRFTVGSQIEIMHGERDMFVLSCFLFLFHSEGMSPQIPGFQPCTNKHCPLKSARAQALFVIPFRRK